MTVEGPSKAELLAAHCWEDVDRVPGRPEMTAFRRRVRLRQARWRERNGLPMGAQPIAPRPGERSRPLGSRLPLEHAERSGANFLTPGARAAVDDRLVQPELHQTLSTQRLWADLLSSMPMCFNLFGDLAQDDGAATAALRAWWPDVPGVVRRLAFEHSPGRLDPDYLGNRSAFDVAFLLELGSGHRGALGIETKYHECTGAEKAPSADRLARYRKVSERSGAFRPDALDGLIGTDLQQIWLDHLLVLSMLQHPSGRWTWGRFVLVHPAGNLDFTDASRRYGELLVGDQTTFASTTIESLLAIDGALPPATARAFRARCLAAESERS